MKNLEQQYTNKLEQQAVVAIGLKRANQTTDGWTKKMYRERMDKINAECCELCEQVNNCHKNGGRI